MGLLAQLVARDRQVQRAGAQWRYDVTAPNFVCEAPRSAWCVCADGGPALNSLVSVQKAEWDRGRP